MKKILGLDLGVASIGWALVNEAEKEDERSSILKLGVRVIPLTTDEEANFLKGKSITTTAERRQKRSMRRNLQRYKQRRENLIALLKEHGIINDSTILNEDGPGTTFETYRLRARAADEEISLAQFARVLLMLNGKRGYKSNRKIKQEDAQGTAIDCIDIAKVLAGRGITPGEYALECLSGGISKIPSFYRSDLEAEFDRIWMTQSGFMPGKFSDELREELRGKGDKATWAILKEPWSLTGLKRANSKKSEQDRETLEWRKMALYKQMGLEELAVVLSSVNRQIASASGYLGLISDRSKELQLGNLTVGQYLMKQLEANPNASLKNQVFYRQDYMDEFDRLWETQSGYHSELTEELRKSVRDETIFYQRPLKSQKGLISLCEFENRQIEVELDGIKKKKTIGLRVCPKSSPLFQEFKVRQVLNNLTVYSPTSSPTSRKLTEKERRLLFNELLLVDKLTKRDALKILFGRESSEYDLNYKEIEGDRTMSALFRAYGKILEDNDIHVGNSLTPESKLERYAEAFAGLGIDGSLLHFDSSLEGQELERQGVYRLWHLLYSYEGDKSPSGNDALARKLHDWFGFDGQAAKTLSTVRLDDDYGSLSAKAIRKILPHLKDGLVYSEACEAAGYRHSARSLTREEIDSRELAGHLEPLPKNSLRNPVVEKILNQMVNVVNAVIGQYGRPDEIRIEMARELKKSAKERQEATESISKATKASEEIRKTLEKDFGLKDVSRNDILRYRLYEELGSNGHKTLYSDTYIPYERLFSKDFNIEHIIPQARRFDDSFANKTLEAMDVNIAKGSMTAFDYVGSLGADALEEYENKVRHLEQEGHISRTKARNLLTTGADIESGFIERELRDTQYIAKKAREILEGVVRTVTPTVGSVTARLREDWQLVDVMRELNWGKYQRLGLTSYRTDADGRQIPQIQDWTKRNDNRHHAMDAVTIAFTKPSYIQYLNNLNARRDKMASVAEDMPLDSVNLLDLPPEERSRAVRSIESKEMHKKNGHWVFNPPIPMDEFRREVKSALDGTLVSIKAKNKVVTENVNSTKARGGANRKIQLTPRGQLHNETIYGRIVQYETKEESVGARFDEAKIATTATKKYREALSARLKDFGGDPKKAFTGKNSLDKNPLWLDPMHTMRVPARVKTVAFKPVYTMRVPISPDLNIAKVIDLRIRKILEERLAECERQLLEETGGDEEKAKKDAPKRAFSNLEEKPIWLDKTHGIAVKRVTISGKSDVYAIHDKRDKDGAYVCDAEGRRIESDFVSTSNNHHVAIYRDASGDLQESVIPFIEAVGRVNSGYPPVDRDYRESEGWEFLFSMKKNEMFVFPNEDTGFDPAGIDLTDPDNYSLISPNLFRVQKLASKYYVFRHHLETNVNEDKALRDTTWKRLSRVNDLKGAVKVRINHLGQIVEVGE